MKVTELIELLKKEDPDAEVWIEGCDCQGKANGIDEGLYADSYPDRKNAITIVR